MDKAFNEMQEDMQARGFISVEHAAIKFLKRQAVSVTQLVAWRFLDSRPCLCFSRKHFKLAPMPYNFVSVSRN